MKYFVFLVLILGCEHPHPNDNNTKCKDMLLLKGFSECPHQKHKLILEIGQVVNNSGQFTKIDSVPVCRCNNER